MIDDSGTQRPQSNTAVPPILIDGNRPTDQLTAWPETRVLQNNVPGFPIMCKPACNLISRAELTALFGYYRALERGLHAK